MKEIRVDKMEISQLMEKPDKEKATGPDEVAGRILKACKEELLKPLYDIIKCSTDSGNVWVEWKRAEVVPR